MWGDLPRYCGGDLPRCLLVCLFVCLCLFVFVFLFLFCFVCVVCFFVFVCMGGFCLFVCLYLGGGGFGFFICFIYFSPSPHTHKNGNLYAFNITTPKSTLQLLSVKYR